MSKSIKLSKKHGVNPTICKCFFCGEDKYIALLGRLKNDAEAPRYTVMDYEPCDKCQEHMSQGVTIIEVTTTQPEDNRPPLTARYDTKVYPLGGYAVIKPEGIKVYFNLDLKAGDKLFVDTEVFRHIMQGFNSNN